MGALESKPSFPSDQEWQEWKKLRDEKITKEIDQIKKSQSQNIDKDITTAIFLFDKYMQECHDKSRLKTFFTDNKSCTIARKDLIQHLLVATNATSNVSESVKKLTQIR